MQLRPLLLVLILFPFICSRGLLLAQSSETADFRYVQSPVTTQKPNETSTACALIAALETFPGVPLGLNAQALSESVQPDVEAPALGDYISVLVAEGAFSGSDDPACPAVTVQEGDYQLLKDQAARHTQNIRDLFDQGYPAVVVSYTAHTPDWEAPSKGEITLDPAFTFTYQGQPVTIAQLNALPDPDPSAIDGWLTDTVASNYAQHTVTLVGYDPTGFWFKNARGSEWGSQGYGRLSFDFHQVFAREALCIYAVSFPPNSGDSLAEKEPLVHLKTTPVFKKNRKAINFSLFFPDACEAPLLSWVKYRVYSHSLLTPDEPRLVATQTVLAPTKGAYDNCLQALLLDNFDFSVSPFLNPLSVRITLQPAHTSQSIELEFQHIRWQTRTYGPVASASPEP